jgi:CubicO group peptidase (beta-lactamase class C family)
MPRVAGAPSRGTPRAPFAALMAAATFCLLALAGCGSASRVVMDGPSPSPAVSHPASQQIRAGVLTDAGTARPLRGAPSSGPTAFAAPVMLRGHALVPVSEPGVGGQKVSPRLDRAVVRLMSTAHIPGVSVALLKRGRLVWSKGYGWADIARRRAVTSATIFMLASISKTVTATAVLQAVQDGYFALDDDVSGIVGFEVRNPRYPGRKITVRMLLEHTSSIRDTTAVWDELYSRGDSPISLRDFLVGYLTPGGAYWHRSNFYSSAPGKEYHYTSPGVDLAAQCVAASTGMPFDEWCRRRVFEPLGMTHTGWFLRDVPAGLVAVPYEWRPTARRYEQFPQYCYPDYPCGQLRTTATQLARFLSAWARGGELDGRRILESSLVREALRVGRPQINASQGLIWYHSGERFGHSGGDYGVSTDMYYDPGQDVGVIVLANESVGRAEAWRSWADLDRRLWAFARSL